MSLAAAACAMAALYVLLLPAGAAAHTALTASVPPEGSMLDSGPSTIRLSFSEPPEPALSQIRLTGADRVEHAGHPASPPQDSNDIEVTVPNLEKGVYTVSWSAVSRVDGHPTKGSFEFGVGVLPGLPDVEDVEPAALSQLEILARWILLIGLIGLLGAAVAGASGFGAERGGALAWVCLGLSGLGLGLLAEAQRRGAATGWGGLIGTTIGKALWWRGLGVGVAGVMLVVAHVGRPRLRRPAMWLAAIAVAGGIAAHVAAGHAASQGWRTVASQWAHFAAAGVWMGGLVALLLAIRGTPSQAKSSMAGRFSLVAGAALLAVVTTGVMRSVGELNSWGDLVETGYGRAVLVKIVLVAGVVGLGAFNRWRNLPRSSTSLGGLRKVSVAEVSLAALALGAAAFLGAAAPPVEASQNGVSASASDFATSVKVRLSVLAKRPGPNRFTVALTDYDSGKPVRAQVALRFFPLDDPLGAPSGLALERRADGTYAGVGNNLAFDGRWRVTTLIQRDNESVGVPLELAVENEPQQLSVLRVPGEPEIYTAETAPGVSAVFWADPNREGPTQLFAGFYDLFGQLQISHAVLTMAAGGTFRQREIRRLGPGSFVAEVTLPEGRTRVSLVGRTIDGTRLRSVVDLELRPAKD